MKFFNLSITLLLTATASLPPVSLAAFGSATVTPGQTAAFARGYPTTLNSATNGDLTAEETATDNAPTFAIPPTTASDEVTPANKDLVNQLLPNGIKLTGGKKLREEGLTGKGIKIAVIDSGIDADHPSFGDQVKQKVWYRSGSPLSEDYHGTHVAGTIHMMAPEAEIYDYRVFGRRGWIGVNTAIARSIRSAIEDGCDIINMSLGAPGRDPRIYAAVKEAYEEGVLMITAAGNSGDGNALTNENMWPANSDETVSIGAVSKRDNLPVADFSNSNDKVDYAGIGVDVRSFFPGGRFVDLSGTSMASPHVCGLVAALMTKGGIYDGQIKDDASLREFIAKFTIDIGVKGRDNTTGLGFLTYLSKEEFEEGFLDLPDHE